jgi:hypothetical protein
MQKISVLSSSVLLILLILLVLVVPVSAAYTNTFDPSDTVVVNQSLVHDPTSNTSTPFILWIVSGILGLFFTIYALVRSKSQRMDYEVNVILSIIAWPFFGYFAWGGMTSVDYIVGVGIAAAGTDIAMITQHILYSPWVLGWVGVMGFVAAAFVTALLVAQYSLFKDTEEQSAKERSRNDKMENMNERS